MGLARLSPKRGRVAGIRPAATLCFIAAPVRERESLLAVAHALEEIGTWITSPSR
ncbi:MAG: hypothetical protein K0S56_4043 [Microvirga sp.]|nr:hypothetical protein [Microvirga sp.]